MTALYLKRNVNVFTRGNPDAKSNILKTSNNVAALVDFDYSKTPQIDSRLTFARSTTATCLAYAATAVAGDLPLVTTCAVNEARFQNARRISEGVWSNVLNDGSAIPLPITLLAEEARTNVFKYSQDFSNAYWTKIGATAIDAASITAPDGTLTGNKFTEDTSNGTHRIIPNTNSGFTIVSGAINSISIYIKRGTRRFVMLQITDAAQAINQSFDLQSGTLATYSGDTSRLVKTAVSIIDSGNGWYRVTLSFTATGSPGNIIYPGIYLCSADNNNSYVGTATETMYFWGAQFELSSPNASSYIPTTTAAVTRGSDVASFTGAGLSWYNAQQGTFAITASGSAFKSPSDFGALSLTYASQTKYALSYNNSVKNGSTYLYTAATLSNPTEYTGVAVPTTIYVNAAGIANISRFTYYPKALKLNQMAALL
jgi:hypothetical protein